MIEIPKHIRELKPYKAGKPIEELAREQNLTRIVKLASNENPLGPSPMAMEAMRQAVSEVHRYTDPQCQRLTAKLSEKYNISPKRIVCGHGTDSLLENIIETFSVTSDEVLTSQGTFIGLYVNARKLGRSLVEVPLVDYRYDLKAIAAAITDKTRIIYLANPNNPTGCIFSQTEFDRLIKYVPNNVLVVLDEAYHAYAVEHDEYFDGLTYEHDNLIVTRTLSKVYGLGGIRVGFAIGPVRLMEQLAKVRLPFEPNHLAQVAAIAAIDDDEFLKRTVATNRRSLKKIEETLVELNIKFLPSAANFILMIMPSDKFAADFYQQCLNRGLIVRHVKPFGIANGVRINSGTDEEIDFALDIIKQVYVELSRDFSTNAPEEGNKHETGLVSK